MKKKSVGKPKSGPKTIPKPTKKLEPESQEILEEPESKNQKDPDFNPMKDKDIKVEKSKSSVRRSRRSATRASTKSVEVRPFTPRVKVGNKPAENHQPEVSVVSNKRKIPPAKTENANVTSRHRYLSDVFTSFFYEQTSESAQERNDPFKFRSCIRFILISQKENFKNDRYHHTIVTMTKRFIVELS